MNKRRMLEQDTLVDLYEGLCSLYNIGRTDSCLQ